MTKFDESTGFDEDSGDRPQGKESPRLAVTASMRQEIGKVASSSAAALIVSELITLVQVIALARLLSPHVVGIYTAGTVLSILLIDVAEGGLRSALVQRQGRIDDVAETVFWATAASGVVLSLGAVAAAPVIGTVFHDSAAGLVAAATCGTMLMYALMNVPDAMLQRRFSVRRGLVAPAASLAFGVVAVTLAACGLGVWSMVIGSYVSSLTSLVCVWWMCDWRPRRGRFSFKLWRELAKFGFPLMVMMFGFRIKNSVEAVIVGRFLGASDLGQYRYAQRIAQIPVKGITSVGGISLLPAFSRISDDPARLRTAYLRALRWSMVAAAPLSALMIALGEPAVVVVFGHRWREAGVAVAAMAGVGVGRAVLSVSQEAIKAVGRTKLIHWCTAVEVVGGLILALVLVRPLGLVGVGLAYSITALAVGISYVGLTRPVVGVSVKSILRAVGPPLPAAAVASVVTLFLDHEVLHIDSYGVLAAIGLLAGGIVVCGLVYLGVLFVIDPTSARRVVAVGAQLARRVTGG